MSVCLLFFVLLLILDLKDETLPLISEPSTSNISFRDTLPAREVLALSACQVPMRRKLLIMEHSCAPAAFRVQLYMWFLIVL